MLLDSSTALEFSVDAGTDVEFVAGAINDSGSALSYVTNSGTSNSTTAVSIIAAPSASNTRIVRNVTLRNAGTVPRTITVRLDISAVDRELRVCTLQAGETLDYAEKTGWTHYDANGRPLLATITSDTGFDGASRFLLKAGTAADTVGYWYCTSKDNGSPGAFTPGTPGMAGRTVLGTTEPGVISFPTPASGAMYLTHLSLASTVAHAHLLFDILWIQSGIAVTTTTAQTVNSVAFPARDNNGTTDGDGLMIGLLFAVAATNAGLISNSTVSYTNEAGTASRTATLAANVGSQIPITPAVGTIVWFNLQAGDRGVRSVQSITLGTSLGAGTVHLLVTRPIAMVPAIAANLAAPALVDADPGIKLWNNTALLHCYMASATTATTVAGTMVLANR